MIEEKKITYPGHGRGFTRFLQDVTEAVRDGYDINQTNEAFTLSKMSCGKYYSVVMTRDISKFVDDPKVKAPELREMAKKSLGLEVPADLKVPAQIKKFIRESLAGDSKE